MADFSFITHEDFRLALDADQAELIRCLDGRAWKAVHVLAGSITEAVLLEPYLDLAGEQGVQENPAAQDDRFHSARRCQAGTNLGHDLHDRRMERSDPRRDRAPHSDPGTQKRHAWPLSELELDRLVLLERLPG